eukprot:6460510-Amphidinium_carterae.1
MLFNYTIKQHTLSHIADDATVLSPRLTWSYSAEDFMQAVRKLIQAQRTVPRYTMLSSTLRKYTCALELDLKSAKLL